ncbi:hypothetical protein INR49_009040, partial [Caranx melampygus]
PKGETSPSGINISDTHNNESCSSPRADVLTSRLYVAVEECAETSPWTLFSPPRVEESKSTKKKKKVPERHANFGPEELVSLCGAGCEASGGKWSCGPGQGRAERP